MSEQTNLEMTAKPSRHFLFWLDFFIPVLVLAAGTVIFRVTSLDLELQSHFFSPASHWVGGGVPLFQLVYHYGNLPALLVAIAGLLLFIQSYRRQFVLKWRRIGLFLVLGMVLGPGLIVNLLLKDNWGRPRPREVEQFGGKFAYERVLSRDPDSPGKSFPCGHATMGYYFFGLYLLLRRERKLLAALVFAFAFSYGGVIGVARMAQGGHFASDVLWAGGLVYLSSAALFYLLRLDRTLWYKPPERGIKLKLYQQIALYLLGLAVVVGVILATPYARHSVNDYAAASRFELRVSMAVGDLDIRGHHQNQLYIQSNGFGFPGSKLIYERSEFGSDSLLALSVSQRKRGFFTELDSEVELSLDSLQTVLLIAHLDEGNLTADLGSLRSLQGFAFSTGKGDIRLKLPPDFADPIYLRDDPTSIVCTEEVRLIRVSEAADHPFSLTLRRGKLLISK